MIGEKRRKELLNKLKASKAPLSGSLCAKEFGVSRQIIVQDVALLRAHGHDIISTSRGYVLVPEKTGFQRVFKVNHSAEQTEEELNIFVDHGCKVKDIFIYHKIYGLIKAPLNLASRLDITIYLDSIKEGQSRLLSSATSGYHYHTIEADSVEILDMVQSKLADSGFLANLTDFEPIEFDK